MRLRRLDLTRYGHFTDYVLDLGAPRPDGADFHVVYGPNEAGKTTAFEGWLDLLFGIPPRSPYGFLHDYDSMEVGALLEVDGSPHEFVRRKRARNDLLGPDGGTANPVVLEQMLGGLDRAAYRDMFSLDDATIEAGGEDILASRGNLGELLFSAAAGLSELGGVLERARDEVDAFHRPRARKTRLAEAKQALNALTLRLREADVSAAEVRALREARDAALSRQGSARAERDAVLQRRAVVEALLECLPLLGELEGLSETLAPVAGLPEVPETWVAEAQRLRDAEVEAEALRRKARDAVEELERRLEAIVRTPRMLAVAAELEVALGVPHSRAQTAEQDLPRRQEELAGLEASLVRTAADLGLSAPGDGAIAEAVLVRLEEISAGVEQAERRLRTARDELAAAERELAEQVAADGQDPDAGDAEAEDDAEELSALLDRLAPEGLAGDLERTRDAEAAARGALDRALEALVPWRGGPGDLPEPMFSAEQAARLGEGWADVLAAKSDAERSLRDAERTSAERSARRNATCTG